MNGSDDSANTRSVGAAINEPVFVVGCPRSGTTWLGHLLSSSGHYANYRAETHFFDLFVPKYGSPSRPAARRRLARAWLESDYHTRTGLTVEELEPRLIAEGTTAGAFLETIMGSIAAAQGCPAWTDSTPAHALFMERISAEIPAARFIHVIRDGRDVALSLARQGWARGLRWDRAHESVVAGWTWRRIVSKAQRDGMRLGERYHEVRFEDLVRGLPTVIERLSSTLGVPLDLDAIRRNAIGSARKPNTSFARLGDSDPVGRWRSLCSPEELANLEGAIGDALLDLGYELAATAEPTIPALGIRRRAFGISLATRHLLKTRTRLGALFVDPSTAAPPPGMPSD